VFFFSFFKNTTSAPKEAKKVNFGTKIYELLRAFQLWKLLRSFSFPSFCIDISTTRAFFPVRWSSIGTIGPNTNERNDKNRKARNYEWDFMATRVVKLYILSAKKASGTEKTLEIKWTFCFAIFGMEIYTSRFSRVFLLLFWATRHRSQPLLLTEYCRKGVWIMAHSTSPFACGKECFECFIFNWKIFLYFRRCSRFGNRSKPQ
jgi:hypothetical protein